MLRQVGLLPPTEQVTQVHRVENNNYSNNNIATISSSSTTNSSGTGKRVSFERNVGVRRFDSERGRRRKSLGSVLGSKSKDHSPSRRDKVLDDSDDKWPSASSSYIDSTPYKAIPEELAKNNIIKAESLRKAPYQSSSQIGSTTPNSKQFTADFSSPLVYNGSYLGCSANVYDSDDFNDKKLNKVSYCSNSDFLSSTIPSERNTSNYSGVTQSNLGKLSGQYADNYSMMRGERASPPYRTVSYPENFMYSSYLNGKGACYNHASCSPEPPVIPRRNRKACSPVHAFSYDSRAGESDSVEERSRNIIEQIASGRSRSPDQKNIHSSVQRLREYSRTPSPPPRPVPPLPPLRYLQHNSCLSSPGRHGSSVVMISDDDRNGALMAPSATLSNRRRTSLTEHVRERCGSPNSQNQFQHYDTPRASADSRLYLPDNVIRLAVSGNHMNRHDAVDNRSGNYNRYDRNSTNLHYHNQNVNSSSDRSTYSPNDRLNPNIRSQSNSPERQVYHHVIRRESNGHPSKNNKSMVDLSSGEHDFLDDHVTRSRAEREHRGRAQELSQRTDMTSGTSPETRRNDKKRRIKIQFSYDDSKQEPSDIRLAKYVEYHGRGRGPVERGSRAYEHEVDGRAQVDGSAPTDSFNADGHHQHYRNTPRHKEKFVRQFVANESRNRDRSERTDGRRTTRPQSYDNHRMDGGEVTTTAATPFHNGRRSRSHADHLSASSRPHRSDSVAGHAENQKNPVASIVDDGGCRVYRMRMPNESSTSPEREEKPKKKGWLSSTLSKLDLRSRKSSSHRSPSRTRGKSETRNGNTSDYFSGEQTPGELHHRVQLKESDSKTRSVHQGSTTDDSCHSRHHGRRLDRIDGGDHQQRRSDSESHKHQRSRRPYDDDERRKLSPERHKKRHENGLDNRTRSVDNVNLNNMGRPQPKPTYRAREHRSESRSGVTGHEISKSRNGCEKGSRHLQLSGGRNSRERLDVQDTSMAASRSPRRTERREDGHRRPYPSSSLTSSLNSSESEVGSHRGRRTAAAPSRISNGSSRSVFLHAATVADIPSPDRLGSHSPSRRRPDSRTNGDRNVGTPQPLPNRERRKVARSFSMAGPFRPRHASRDAPPREVEINYENSTGQPADGRPPKHPQQPRSRAARQPSKSRKPVTRSASMPREVRPVGWQRTDDKSSRH